MICTWSSEKVIYLSKLKESIPIELIYNKITVKVTPRDPKPAPITRIPRASTVGELLSSNVVIRASSIMSLLEEDAKHTDEGDNLNDNHTNNNNNNNAN